MNRRQRDDRNQYVGHNMREDYRSNIADARLGHPSHKYGQIGNNLMSYRGNSDISEERSRILHGQNDDCLEEGELPLFDDNSITTLIQNNSKNDIDSTRNLPADDDIHIYAIPKTAEENENNQVDKRDHHRIVQEEVEEVEEVHQREEEGAHECSSILLRSILCSNGIEDDVEVEEEYYMGRMMTV